MSDEYDIPCPHCDQEISVDSLDEWIDHKESCDYDTRGKRVFRTIVETAQSLNIAERVVVLAKNIGMFVVMGPVVIFLAPAAAYVLIRDTIEYGKAWAYPNESYASDNIFTEHIVWVTLFVLFTVVGLIAWITVIGMMITAAL